jgi:hypothetical protein
MVKLFQPQIGWLQTERDEAVKLWQLDNPEAKQPVYEDHGLEVTSVVEVSVQTQIKLVRKTAAVAD